MNSKFLACTFTVITTIILLILPSRTLGLKVEILTPVTQIQKTKRILLEVRPEKNEIIHQDSMLLSLDSEEIKLKKWTALEDPKSHYLEPFKRYKSSFIRPFTLELILNTEAILPNKLIQPCHIHFSCISTKNNKTTVEQKVVKLKTPKQKKTSEHSKEDSRKAHESPTKKKALEQSKALQSIYKSHYPKNRFVLFLILFLILAMGTLILIGNVLSLLDATILASWFAIYMLTTTWTSLFIAHSITVGTSLTTSVWFLFFSWKQKNFRWKLVAQIIGIGFAAIVLPSIAQAYLASGLL